MTYNTGDRYEGEWVDNKRNGKGKLLNKTIGTFYFFNGEKYEGEWKDSQMHGKGFL